MKFAVIKLLDAENNVIGYKTNGLSPELCIEMFIEEDTAEEIFRKVAVLKTIPSELNNVANVKIITKKTKGCVKLLLPDINGNY